MKLRWTVDGDYNEREMATNGDERQTTMDDGYNGNGWFTTGNNVDYDYDNDSA